MDVGLLVESLPKLWEGVLVTLQLVGLALLAGGLLAVPIALARASQNPLLRWPAYGYIFFFRATPLLVQLFLIYYGSGQFRAFFQEVGLWPILREAYWCAIIAFSLNTAAYTAEILRGGIEGVPHGEVEAARAVGMSRGLILRRIVLPNAYRLALPAYGNEIILMLKASALASIVTLFDLMGATRALFARTFALELFLYAAVIYLCLTLLISSGIRTLERALHPERRPPRQA